ncbi:DUF927 domain-containing protein [Andreprevotia chitinilytica]|uniref:DUF927 domain-containing protein n=1 Tax=Andreprevotia chitinilytica TaxID=396808 RepID=UPI00068F3CD9|nr:DUF927 domain-containing protein [Andreprevotia chitinilytica]
MNPQYDDLQQLFDPAAVPPMKPVTKPAAVPTAAANDSTKPAARKRGTSAKPSAGSSAERFQCKDDGVYYRADADSEERQVCGPLHIIAQVRDLDGGNWSVLVRLRDLDGKAKDHVIPRAKLLSDQSLRALEELADKGLWFSHAADLKKRAVQYLQTNIGVPRARLVPRTGWHGSAFVLPEQVIGSSDELMVYHGGAAAELATAGSLDGWRDGVAQYAVGNPLLTLTLSAALAGPLMAFFGMDSGGFHLAGPSKNGKSVACRVAASVFGSPSRYEKSWQTTATGAEAQLEAHNDLPLILDEIGRAKATDVAAVVYMLSQGQGKSRGRAEGGLRAMTRWRCFVLSNGEHSVANYLSMHGVPVNAGQLARLLHVSAERRYGAFDALHGFADHPALCEAIAKAADRQHGVVGMAWLEKLASVDADALRRQLDKGLTKFAAACVPAGASGQARHAANYFALAAFAGETATAAGLTGWPPETAWQAAAVLYADWLKYRGGAGNEEDRQVLRQVRLFFEQHGEARFTRWDRSDAVVDEHGPKTLARCGFRKTEVFCEDGTASGNKAAQTTYYVFRQSWASEVLKGCDLKRANRLLLDLGVLLPGKDGKASKTERLPGMGSDRVYVVLPALWQLGSDDDA